MVSLHLAFPKLLWTIFVTWSCLTPNNDYTLAFALASSSAPKWRTVLVTGGAGYIGSHTCLELLNVPQYKVVVVDNLDNSSEEAVRRVRELTNCDPERLCFRKCDIRDKQGLQQGVFTQMSEGLVANFLVQRRLASSRYPYLIAWCYYSLLPVQFWTSFLILIHAFTLPD